MKNNLKKSCDFFCGAKLWCFLGWEGRVKVWLSYEEGKEKVGNREQEIGSRE